MAILTVKDLSFWYPEQKKPAIEKVSFSVEAGAFVTLCGTTGCGKSTLLRLCKRELMPHGTQNGSVCFQGKPLSATDARTAASDIGFVAQQPEQQIVTDKVWHELAFGLENLGLPQQEIRRRVAEMASYFGITDWFERDTASLSGGQKQLLNLAAVMIMQPKLLLLDEPTAQLDPIAAGEFIATLHQLNRELSLTILITEHRLEEVVPLSDALMVMEHGTLTAYDSPRNVLSAMPSTSPLLGGMPAAARLYHALGAATAHCPLTQREGRAYLQEHCTLPSRLPVMPPQSPSASAPALEWNSVYQRYHRNAPDVLSDFSLCIYEGECFCLLGGNGAGKSTALKAAAGLLKPYAGSIRVFGKKQSDYTNGALYHHCLAMLPQNVQTLFVKNTVKEELAEIGTAAEAFPFALTQWYDRHPYDVSGGEQQLIALAKIMGQKPRILLLDEPTKGLDADAKARLGQVLRALQQQGVTIVIVTHDIAFSAVYAQRCGLLFRGNLIAAESPDRFFAGNHFYTTAAHRMSRGLCENAITVEQLAQYGRQRMQQEDDNANDRT
ncbi:MAG: ATP-binding cassette domain-containing protein [Oscillospiraceae bacterium]|nr:ATP-binding cassette domain-containing protein [Oscillospiraceae bacterium]